jgi:hypothetical protein
MPLRKLLPELFTRKRRCLCREPGLRRPPALLAPERSMAPVIGTRFGVETSKPALHDAARDAIVVRRRDVDRAFDPRASRPH